MEFTPLAVHCCHNGILSIVHYHRGCGRGVGAGSQVGRDRTREGRGRRPGREGHVRGLDAPRVSGEGGVSAAGSQDRQSKPLMTASWTTTAAVAPSVI